MTESFGGFIAYGVVGDYGVHKIWGLGFIL
jgi:hypothetical protein